MDSKVFIKKRAERLNLESSLRENGHCADSLIFFSFFRAIMKFYLECIIEYMDDVACWGFLHLILAKRQRSELMLDFKCAEDQREECL